MWQEAIMLVSCLASALKMEAICSSETSVDLSRTTLRYFSEDMFFSGHFFFP
jgi:hypothetical protein